MALQARRVAVFEPTFLDAIADEMDERTKLELTRNVGMLYVVAANTTLEAPLVRSPLVAE